MCDVAVATGEVFHTSIDVDVPGFPPFELSRSYSSARAGAGSLGPGWTHNWEVKLAIGDGSARLSEGAAERVFELGAADDTKPKVSRMVGASGVEVREPNGGVLRFGEPAGPNLWFLTERADAHGNRTVLFYERQRLAQVRDSSGREVLLEYEDGWLAEVTLQHRATSARVRYSHGAGGTLTAVRHHTGATERYRYDDNLLVEYVSRSGTVRHLRYDDKRRCIFDWFQDALRVRTIELYYPRVMVTDSYGYRELYDLDTEQRIVRVTDPLARTREWVYGPDGGVVAQLLEDGTALRTMTYDVQSRTLTGCDLHGAKTVYRFLASGAISHIVNTNGQQRRYVRDSFGDVISLAGPEEVLWQFEYDERGALRRVVDPEGRWLSRSEVDGVVTVSDQLGRIATYVFDPLGNLLTETDALERVTEYAYEGQDRLSAMRLPHGGVFRWTLDGAGRILAVTDPIGRTTRYEYTSFGSVQRRVYPHGREIAVQFDREENIIAIQNGKGERTTIQRDEAYRPVRIVFFDGRIDSHEFDSRNRVVGLRNGRGELVRFEYDEAANPTRLTFADGSIQTNTYDGLENLLAMSFEPSETSELPPSECRLTFDGNRLVVAEENDGYEVRYDHDKSGALIGIRDSVGRDIRLTRGVRRLVERLDEADVSFRFEYTATGEIAAILLPNGMVQRFEYDASARLVRRDVVSGTLDVLAWRTFSYDSASQLVHVDDWRSGRLDYHYDDGGRLTSVVDASGRRQQEYLFDIEGNLVASPDYVSSEIGAGNRFRRAGEDRFEYDGAGCLRRWQRSDATYVYSYGPFDQLSSVARNGERFAMFRYDLHGRRTATEYPDGEIHYSYHLNTLASLSSAQLGSWHFLYVPGTFVPLSQASGRRRYFYSCDQIGTPTELWNEEGGLVATITSNAFGSRRTVNYLTDDRPPVPFHFQGQIVDERLDLHYNRFRYYCPYVAAFVTHDPIGLAIDANLYVYPRNPLTWVDPFGLATLEITCGLKTRAFDACEQYAAKQKLEQINNASRNRRKKTCSKCRENEQREYFIETCGGSPSSGNQVDHLLELQLGGADYCCDNLMAIPASVNQSFGSQIKNLISGLAEGALVPKFAFAPPGCDQADNCTNKDAVTQRGTKSDGKDCSKEPPLDC